MKQNARVSALLDNTKYILKKQKQTKTLQI